jgi:hypothetical protein
MLDTRMDDIRDIPFTRHEGRRGVAWLRASYALFRRARLPWLVLVLSYYFVLFALQWVPFAGGLALLIMKPVFSVGFLAAAWNQERGVTPSPRHLFQGFRSNLWALVPLGMLIVLNLMIAGGVTALIDGGRLFGLLLNPSPPELDQDAVTRRVAETFADPRVQFGMFFAVLCALPLILALWWAPALVVFQDAGLRTALRASLRAALANWRPILRWCLVVFLFTTLLPSVVVELLFLAIPQPPGLMSYLVFALFTLYLWSVVAVIHISDYMSYRDVFHSDETLAPVEHARHAS